ncbi:hypothetical protein F5Y18DRAFT_259709 [Xylariaceae sp. FL1019]|nr:hypothetical protein F5Y18DRAFT_259709 [Xylariaceae sp. FL1019]
MVRTYFRVRRESGINTSASQASFPNLRRLFVDARSDGEEREVSRRAVSHYSSCSSSQLLRALLADYIARLVLQCCAVHGFCGRLQFDSSEDECP